MKSLEQIRLQLSAGEFEFSRHALKRAVERNISDSEIAQVSENAELIEDYPDDKYSPSCLILGFTHENRPLHILFLSAVQMFVMQVGHVMMTVFHVGMRVEMGMELSKGYTFNVLMDVVTVIVLVGMFMRNFSMDVMMLMFFIYQ